MMYVIGAMYVILMGVIGGWYFYNICASPKKNRLRVAIVWGIGIAIISALAAFGS